MQDIHTTAKEIFSALESTQLARLIYKRFGRDIPAAADAWRRLLQNNCTDNQFIELLQLSFDWEKIQGHMEGFGLDEYEDARHYANHNPEAFGVTSGDWRGWNGLASEDQDRLIIMFNYLKR
jgi:hypothetical protein